MDHELSRGIQKTCVLALILIIDVEFTCSQVEGLRLRVKKGFTEPDLTVGDKANLPSGRSWNQPTIAKIVVKRADNRDVTYSFHVRQRVHQPLVLALCERVHQVLSHR